MIVRTHDVLFTLFLIIFTSQLNADETLYTKEDPILQLDITNFNQTVYDQVHRRGYFIEYYSSYCGHCIAYRPTWIKFGKALEQWSNVVPVSAINCADDKNSPICREHAIDAFPTIKYFKFGSKSATDGQKYEGDKYNIETMATDLAKFVHEDWLKQHHPPDFAHFNEITDSDTNIQTVFGKTIECDHVALIIEKEISSISYAVSIQFNNDPRVKIYHATADSPLVKNLGDVNSVPKLVIFKKPSSTPIYSSVDTMTLTQITDKLSEEFSNIVVAHIPKLAVEMAEKEIVRPLVPVNKNQYKSQYGDLLSAIKYMIYTEIPRKPVIDGTKFAALKPWVQLLKKYVPGTTPIKRFFFKLDEWLQTKGDSMTSDEWIVKINEIQQSLGNPIPSKVEWVACKGSKNYLRGFTCGLWTLMHTITVEAYVSAKGDASFSPRNDVLEPIHQFIVNYLSCEICAKNFNHMTEQNSLALVTRPEDAILWLWRAHNNVNKRLSGEQSDDPLYPKRQFPPKEICAECVVNENEGTFDESKIVNFMVRYHQNIYNDGLSDEPAYKLLKFENGKLVGEENKELQNKVEINNNKVDTDFASFNETILEQSQDLHTNGASGSSSSTTTFFIWFMIIGGCICLVLTKFRANILRLMNNYNDYNRFGRDNTSGGKGKYEV